MLNVITKCSEAEMIKFFNEWLYPMGLGLVAGITFATLIFLGI